MGTENRTDLQRQLYNIRGYQIKVECSQGFQAKRMSSFDSNDTALISIHLLHLGAPGNESDENSKERKKLYPENDPFIYRWIGSPFPEDPKDYITQGVRRDHEGGLWCTYYNELYVKDSNIYESGLQIRFDVPEILSKKKPVIKITCNEQLIYQETILHEGIVDLIIDVRTSADELYRYIEDVRSQQAKLIGSFSNICRQYGLKWYLICGGLIGTVRDGDLIPWDDDLDIAMPREDYNRFLNLSTEELHSVNLMILNYDDYGEDIFVDFMTRLLYMKETIKGDPFSRIGNRGRQDIHYHLPMDIYILENTKRSRFLQWITSRKRLLLYGLALGHRVNFESDKRRKNTSVNWFFGNMLRRIGKRIRLQRIFQWYRKEESHSNKGDYYYFSNGYYKSFVKTFPKDWFTGGRNVTLLKQDIPIPKESELFLEEMYGDYRNYPLIWDRTPEYIRTEWEQ